jgi:6-phosphogluconolactonase
MRTLGPPRLLWLVLTFGLIHLPVMSAEVSATKHQTLVYIGTYTGGKSKGIYAARFDSATGALTTPELAAETKNPTFLALHPNGRWLYAVGEINNFGGTRAGAVSAFSIEQETGKLTLLNQQPSGGGGPCHVAVERTGKCVLVANYGSGSVAALPLQTDGRLGEPSTTIQHHGSSVNPRRQAGPHAHFITPDSANRFALACDLGLDKVLVYRLDADRGGLAPNDPASAGIKPGSGPRHLTFHPNGKWVYLINEMGSTLTVLVYDAERGSLHELQTVATLPDDFKGENTSAEVQVAPSGKFVYGSNRGHDSIAVFAIDPKSGKLSLVERQSTQGKTPRHFALDPTGRWLLAENQDSNSIVVFRVDPKTGRLTPAGQKEEVGSPVCAVFAPEK